MTAVLNTEEKCIPPSFRRAYIPGWSDISEELYEQFATTGAQEMADELLHSLDTTTKNGQCQQQPKRTRYIHKQDRIPFLQYF